MQPATTDDGTEEHPSEDVDERTAGPGGRLEATRRELYEDLGSPRPSQSKLHEDQQTAISRFVDDGYPSRRGFLVDGLFEVAWYSLGRYLKPRWYAHVGREDSVLACAITGDERTRYLHRPLQEAAAEKQRRRLAKKYLRPAFRAGYRELRANSQEYVQEDNRVDPRDLSMFAMRPAMHFYRERQRAALADFLDGFSDAGAVDAWLHEFDDATLGEVARVNPDLDWQLEMQSMAHEVLVSQTDAAVRQREKLAAYLLLPAVSLTPQALLDRAQELREEGDTDRMEYTDL